MRYANEVVAIFTGPLDSVRSGGPIVEGQICHVMELLQLPQHIIGSDLTAFVDGMQKISFQPEQMHACVQKQIPAGAEKDCSTVREHCPHAAQRESCFMFKWAKLSTSTTAPISLVARTVTNMQLPSDCADETRTGAGSRLA